MFADGDGALIGSVPSPDEGVPSFKRANFEDEKDSEFKFDWEGMWAIEKAPQKNPEVRDDPDLDMRTGAWVWNPSSCSTS